jgi:hypothetical protein
MSSRGACGNKVRHGVCVCLCVRACVCAFFVNLCLWLPVIFSVSVVSMRTLTWNIFESCMISEVAIARYEYVSYEYA